jgi:arsenite methyltransferase
VADYELYSQPEFRRAAGSEFRPGGLALTEELAVACHLQPGERVLDLACGPGSTASHLASRWGVRAWGLDSSPGFLEEGLRRDPRVEWVLGAAEAMPIPDERFDALFAECFLSTVADLGAVLREIGRVLRPGGLLAVSDVYLRRPEAGAVSLAPRASCFSHALGKEALHALLARCGFVIRMWQDRSDALKVFTASLILEYGSAAAFWSAGRASDPQGLLAQISAARPGYFLLVAESAPQPAVA